MCRMSLRLEFNFWDITKHCPFQEWAFLQDHSYFYWKKVSHNIFWSFSPPQLLSDPSLPTQIYVSFLALKNKTKTSCKKPRSKKGNPPHKQETHTTNNPETQNENQNKQAKTNKKKKPKQANQRKERCKPHWARFFASDNTPRHRTSPQVWLIHSVRVRENWSSVCQQVTVADIFLVEEPVSISPSEHWALHLAWICAGLECVYTVSVSL